MGRTSGAWWRRRSPTPRCADALPTADSSMGACAVGGDAGRRSGVVLMPARSGAAKRYAEALAGIARQTGAWARWREQLHAAQEVLSDPTVQLTLASPRVGLERKLGLIDTALGERAAPEVRNLLKVMVQRGRFDLLDQVIEWFDEYADRALGIRRFVVTSAVPLTDDQREQLRRRLAGPGGQAVFAERVDPAILGGLVIQHEDVIRDYSVRARLESLRERLN